MHVSFGFQRNDFCNIGIFIVLSIIYGGNGFPFLAKPVFDYLTSGHYSAIVPEAEIPDASLRLIIIKVAIKIWYEWQLYSYVHSIGAMC